MSSSTVALAGGQCVQSRVCLLSSEVNSKPDAYRCGWEEVPCFARHLLRSRPCEQLSNADNNAEVLGGNADGWVRSNDARSADGKPQIDDAFLRTKRDIPPQQEAPATHFSARQIRNSTASPGASGFSSSLCKRASLDLVPDRRFASQQ